MNPVNIKDLRVNVRSSLIDYLEYDCYHQLLKVKFKKGKSKRKAYQGITSHQFLSILSSESVGKAVLKLG